MLSRLRSGAHSGTAHRPFASHLRPIQTKSFVAHSQGLGLPPEIVFPRHKTDSTSTAIVILASPAVPSVGNHPSAHGSNPPRLAASIWQQCTLECRTGRITSSTARCQLWVRVFHIWSSRLLARAISYRVKRIVLRFHLTFDLLQLALIKT